MSHNEVRKQAFEFVSPVARCFTLFGFIGSIGFLGFVPGWEAMQRTLGLLALFSIAVGIEMACRIGRPQQSANQGNLSGIGGFRSAAARWCAVLGCLGFTGFLGYTFGSEQMTAATALLGLIGVGYGVEFLQRLRLGVPLFRTDGR